MNIFVDVDIHQLIQTPGSRSPASTWEVKSQDTLAANLFFCSGGNVLDMGESPVLKFGLVAKSDLSTFLVFESVFTRQVDPVLGVFYQALCAFNTTDMVAALAILSPLPCILEIRFQLGDGEIVHTLDQNVIIDRTILIEGGTPATTVIAVYPDPSVLEVKSNKDQPSGYAALDSGAQLTPSVIPIDGSTIVLASGKLSAVTTYGGIAATTTGAFTVPAVNDNVTIPVPTAGLLPNNYYSISGGAGCYFYISATDTTHGLFMNNGGWANATAGTVIAYPANLVFTGPPGAQGPTGSSGAGLIWQGAWSGATAYNVGDAVSLGGSSYICIVAHTNQTPPNAAYWNVLTAIGTPGTSFTWQGAWLIGTAYNVNDVVSQSGSSYICTVANTGNNPLTDGGVHWIQMAAGGTSGTNGTNGISFIWQGAWSSGTAYVANNVVSQAGSTWICILANTGSTPSTDSGVHWALMAEVGSSTGDMTKAVYDTAVRGYVDRAVLADTATLAAGLSSAITESQVTGLVTDLGALGTSIAAKSPTLIDDETSAGITLLGTTAGHVKRLIAGTNVTLDAATTPGGVIVNAAGGGGGSAVFAQVWASGTQTAVSNTAIPFDTVILDASGMWSSGNPGYLTAPTAGLYFIQAQLNLISQGAGYLDAYVGWVSQANKRFGTTVLMDAVTGTYQNIGISGIIYLAAGEGVCVGIFAFGSTPYPQIGTVPHYSSSNGPGWSPMFSMAKLGN